MICNVLENKLVYLLFENGCSYAIIAKKLFNNLNKQYYISTILPTSDVSFMNDTSLVGSIVLM